MPAVHPFESDHIAYCVGDNGQTEFLPDCDVPEGHDDFCVLGVDFTVSEIYPADSDTGADWDWNGHVSAVHMRIVGEGIGLQAKWRKLNGFDRVRATAHLNAYHYKALWRAGTDFADGQRYGEAA